MSILRLETWEGILDMEMPSLDTSYWCSLHKGPPLNKSNYVVGVSLHYQFEVERRLINC